MEAIKRWNDTFYRRLFLLNNNNKDKLFKLSFLDNFFTDPCVQLNKKDFEDVRHIIELIAIEQNHKDKSQTITQSLLQILLAKVQRCIDTDIDKPIVKKYLILFKQFKTLLDQHFTENKTTAFFADKLNVTTHHLNLISKNVTGKTASDVIRTRSILEAKRLLTFTDFTVTEIATYLNYFDSSYFSKIFKAETQKTPASFKNEMSENTE